MITKVITIEGVDYTVSSSTNLGIQDAEIQLKNSLGINQKAMKKAKKKNKNTDGI
tara:strand:+ start:7854 stop:8018 length:165 start_codon:yes stop_codon:yes gene_type:complete